MSPQLSMTGTLKGGILLLALLVTVALLAFGYQPTEPHLNSIPLSHYLDKQTYGELRTERDARESIRDFGTNAVPYLIRILEARESKLKTKELRIASLAFRTSSSVGGLATMSVISA